MRPLKTTQNSRPTSPSKFPEEYDFQYDSLADASDRRMGKNPMNQEYIDRITQKRGQMRMSPLNDMGLSTSNDTLDFCHIVAHHMITEPEYSKKILYIDMDNVLVDFQSGIDQLSEETPKEYNKRLDEVPGIFSLMAPTKGAIETVEKLAQLYDVYILSTAPWKNPSAWSDKLLWIKQYLPEKFKKKLILSHHKDLNQGDYLIDDRTKNGAGEFQGQHIHFLTNQYPDWESVMDYLAMEFVRKEKTNN